MAGERSIKVWDARTGKPVRVLKNVLDSDITVMELDTHHRKLIVGSHTGEVKVFDLISGVNILTLDAHDPQEGEISFIGYGGEDHTIVTCGWDRVIKIHMDEVYDYSLPQENGNSDGHRKSDRPKSQDKMEKRKLQEVQDPRWPYGKIKQPKVEIENSYYNTA